MELRLAPRMESFPRAAVPKNDRAPHNPVRFSIVINHHTSEAENIRQLDVRREG